MLVIVGVGVLLLAAVIAIAGVLGNAGAAHPPTDFSVFGYHLSGSTGTVFLFGIVVGAVALLGLSVLFEGARRALDRAQEARRADARFRRQTAFINRELDTRLDY
jgi:TRAP-type C4-dicarboxylate transport system permease large subunit